MTEETAQFDQVGIDAYLDLPDQVARVNQAWEQASAPGGSSEEDDRLKAVAAGQYEDALERLSVLVDRARRHGVDTNRVLQSLFENGLPDSVANKLLDILQESR